MTERDQGVFADVDRSGMAPELVAYLERVGRHPTMREIDRHSYDMLAVGPGHRILEVGCGLGDDARDLAMLAAPDGRVVAVDVSETMVAEAARRADGDAVTYQLGDVRQLDFPDGSFDRARAERVFQHLASPAAAAAAREMVRVVRRGGRVALVDTDWQTLVVDVPHPDLLARMSAHLAEFGVQPYAGRQLRRLLLDAGLVDVDVRVVTLVETTLAGAAALLPMLDERIPAGHGLVPDDVRDRWFAALREADGRGRFLASLSGFAVAGRKP